MGAADALHCDLADHYVPSQSLPELLTALAHAPVREVIGRYAREAPPGELALAQAWIDDCYRAHTVEGIIERLLDHGYSAAKQTAETLLTKSPTALKVTLAALRRARRLGPLESVLNQEYRVSCHALTTPDLVEGIRAQVIDKDRDPQWSPPTLAAVTDADVERFFAPLGDRELGLAAPDITQ